jgi:HlyD family secretion protein
LEIKNRHPLSTVDNPIELRSQEIDAILGRTPNRLVRNGIMVIFGAMLLILGGTVFFPYPDVISCRMMITSSNPAVHLTAQTSGRISELLVNDRQKVAENQLLAVLENPADTEDMLLLEAVADSMKENGFDVADTHFMHQHLKLGDVTPYYQEFRKALNDYRTFEALRYHLRKIEATEFQMELTEKYRQRLTEQLTLLEEDLAIELRNYRRDSVLIGIRAITPAEIDLSHSRLLQKKHALTGAKIALENAQMQLNQQQIVCLDLQTEYQQQKRQFIDQVSGHLDVLQHQLALWEKNYAFRSPGEGTVSFANVWATQQSVIAGEPVISILPLHEGKIIGKMEIPTAGSGKIKQGQKLTIKLDNYPYMEFGVVRGAITSIAPVPVKSTAMSISSAPTDVYIAGIDLPDGLHSNYGMSIPFGQEMGGTADIIIEDMSLFERLLQPVRSAIQRK